jgi:large subunit ribosomal protein L27
MATRKAAGSTKNTRTSNPKYLGIKISDGGSVTPGMIIIRQRGTKVMAGKNVALGKDHTIFSMTTGTVKFRSARKTNFDGKTTVRRIVDVVTV